MLLAYLNNFDILYQCFPRNSETRIFSEHEEVEEHPLIRCWRSPTIAPARAVLGSAPVLWRVKRLLVRLWPSLAMLEAVSASFFLFRRLDIASIVPTGQLSNPTFLQCETLLVSCMTFISAFFLQGADWKALYFLKRATPWSFLT